MKYIYKHGNQFWYQRAVPCTLREIIGLKSIKIPLKTNKLSTAIKRSKIQALEHKKMFEIFLKNSQKYLKKLFTSKSNSIKAHEVKFIEDYDDLVSKLVFSKSSYLKDLKNTLSIKASDSKSIEKFLFENSDVDLPLFSQILRKSSNSIVEQNDELFQFKNEIKLFLSICDNKPIHQYDNNDTKSFKKYFEDKNQIQEGRLFSKKVAAIFSILSQKYKYKIKNVFKNIKWRSSNLKHADFSDHELAKIKELCLNKPSVISYFIALMFNTGCSLKEVTGLEYDDVCFDKITPFIIIRSNSKRQILNLSKKRTIPLVGISLWGAEKIFVNKVTYDQITLSKLDKGISTIENLINKNLKIISKEKSSSSFKYSLIRRLVSVECPEEVILEIIGNKKKMRFYNKEVSLEVKSSWLKSISESTLGENAFIK